jgi:site-specific recombinase XerD
MTPNVNLQSKTARQDLAPRGKPYKTSLGRGVTLGYRKPAKGAGAWVVIGSDGNGGQWTDTFARADDIEASDGDAVLTYAEARRQAEALAQGQGAVVASARPVTIDEALTNYTTDLAARGGNVGNARHVRYHFPKALLPELLSRVSSKQLADWRRGLLQRGMNPSTLNRLLKSVHACFNLAAREDKRVAANASEWRIGLTFIAGADTARKALLEPAQVRALVAAAYDISECFGVYVQSHAELGSRSDQIARITCGDVGADQVMVPNSGKGRGRHKSRAGATAVALTADLARRFGALAARRPDDAVLLLDPDGEPWTGNRTRPMLLRAKKAAKVSRETTLIAFRHSSIVRALRAGVDHQTVADWHNTSVRMIETNYARYARDTHVDLIRRALLDTAPMQNVVQLTA